MGNSISILSYFQEEEGCGDHLASILNALVSQLKRLDSTNRTDSEPIS